MLGVFSITEHLDHHWSNCLNLPSYQVWEQSKELFCVSIWGEEQNKQIKARKQIFPAYPSYLRFPDAHWGWNHTRASSFRREVAAALPGALAACKSSNCTTTTVTNTAYYRALLLFKKATRLLVRFIILWLCFVASELCRAVQFSNLWIEEIVC